MKDFIGSCILLDVKNFFKYKGVPNCYQIDLYVHISLIIICDFKYSFYYLSKNLSTKPIILSNTFGTIFFLFKYV
jgi:hypothetical protein